MKFVVDIIKLVVVLQLFILVGGGNTEPKVMINNFKIRKLTPKECLRLMGVKDKEINKFTVSDSQKYKQARK